MYSQQTSTKLRRRPSPLLAAALLTVLTAAAMAAWITVSDQPSPDSGALSGLGPILLLAVIEFPLMVGLTIAALRLAGARSGWLGVAFIAGFVWIGAAGGIDPPLVVWPLAVGAVAAVYLAVEPRLIPVQSNRPHWA